MPQMGENPESANVLATVLSAYQAIADRFDALLGLHQQRTAALAITDLVEFNSLGLTTEAVFSEIIRLRGDALPLVEKMWRLDVPPSARSEFCRQLDRIDVLLDRISGEQRKHNRRIEEIRSLRSEAF